MKKLFIIMIGVLAFQYAQAQGTMKDPVSFRLKNGINVVIAENAGMGKVYASIKIEGEPVQEGNKAGVHTILGNLLNDNAINKNKAAFENNGKEVLPKMSINSSEGNLAADAADFENAFLVLSDALENPVLDERALRTYTESDNDNITLEEVTNLYNKHITPSRTYITIAGDITVPAAKALIKKTFGEWKENNPVSLSR